MTSLLSSAATMMVVAQTTDPGGQGEDFGKSTPVGFILLIVFFIAVAFLIRSMTKHLRRVPASFDPPESAADSPETSNEPTA